MGKDSSQACGGTPRRMFFDASPSIKTLRFVSWNVLERVLRWTTKIKFLRRISYVKEQVGLHEDDGVVECLVE